MEFIAINLDDFHKNQKDAGTTASMIFIEAENITKAKKFVERNRPESPWAIVWKQIFDANIVTGFMGTRGDKPGRRDIMGINIILNRRIYHFDDDAALNELLDQAADGAGETDRDNAVLYDDEMD